jgi:hypothetical protein
MYTEGCYRCFDYRYRSRGSNKKKTKITMMLYFGTQMTPLYMDSGKEYSFVDTMDRCTTLVDGGSQLFLEYHPGLTVKLRSPNQLELACQMVVDYHNLVCVPQEKESDIWGDQFAWVDKLCGPAMMMNNIGSDNATAAAQEDAMDTGGGGEDNNSGGGGVVDIVSEEDDDDDPFGDLSEATGTTEEEFLHDSVGDIQFNAMPLWTPSQPPVTEG